MPRVGYFDVSADEPERAIRFYENVIDWKIEKMEGFDFDYWQIKTGGPDEAGIDGGLAKREDRSQLITPFIDVPSVDEYAAKIEAEGGQIIQSKIAIKGYGYIVAFHDTEGNTLGIMEVDPTA